MAAVSESSSSSEDEETALAVLLLSRRNKRKLRASQRTCWSRQWISRRNAQGMYNNLIQELNVEDPTQLKAFHRIDRESFYDILAMVEPLITKETTVMRSSISASERLSLTLRYLATGESFESLSMQYRLGNRTASGIVEETCKALYVSMKENFLKTPTSSEEWLAIAEGFEEKWNYPCCIGAIDGKHIAIKQPASSGSEFFNYKHFFSVLLLAIADSNYRFVYVDVGAAGRAGDAGVFNDSSIKKALDDNALNLPDAKCIGESETKINYHLVGDDAFALKNTMMKPFPHRNLDKRKRIFNYRLSRARRVIENAFGILANRFRVFLMAINLSPDKVTSLILAACCLHNYLVDKNKHSYASVGDIEKDNHSMSAGMWRSDPALQGMVQKNDRNPTKDAKAQREFLATYFSESGAVPWQDSMV